MPVVEHPSVASLDELLALIRRIEAAHPERDALTIAQMLLRSKYHTPAWDLLLPSSAAVPPVTARDGVTEDDARTLAGDFTVSIPQGGRIDPSHVVAGIVAAAETQPPGGQYAERYRELLVAEIAPELTQLDIATWAGDVGWAIAEWTSARPHPEGGATREDYLEYYAPEADLAGDVDGVAMTSGDPALGFAFDFAAPLSANLHRFYHPAGSREGKHRSFHIFCALLDFPLQPDGVTLAPAAVARMDARVRHFGHAYAANDPEIRRWVLASVPQPRAARRGGGLVAREWARRGPDWRWFAERFRALVQRTLIAEGA
jgi:hypothetical protein